MKVFLVVVTSLIAVALADQSHHQSFKQGNAPAVTTSIHKPHHGAHAIVASQPSAQPSEVNQYQNEEKYAASAHAPVPLHANKQDPYAPHANRYPVHHRTPIHPVSYRPAPIAYKPAPVAYKPAPVSYKPAPVAYKPAPVAYKPAPVTYKPAPVTYKPAPVTHKPAPVSYKPTPAPYRPPVHKPVSSYHEPAYEGPVAYEYNYAVADDYSGAIFNANENRNDYATNGQYSVNLPDGRKQIVTYNVDDAYSGYVADVQYEGEASYPEYKPVHPTPSYKPAPYHPSQ